MLLTTNEGHVTYPVVIVEIEGVKCRALLDSAAGSSYVSSSLISIINKKPTRRDTKLIDTFSSSENYDL